MKEFKNDDIAIIGYAFEFPNGIINQDDFWKLLIAGDNTIKEIPENRWDWSKVYSQDPNAMGKSYSYHGSFLDNIESFDPEAFKIMPVEANNIDPQQRLALKTSWRALENSFLDIESLKHSNTGVFFGATMDDYLQIQSNINQSKDINRYTHFGSVLNNIAGRVSYTYGFRGPSEVVDTACSSSLAAIDMAIKAIKSGDSNIAIAGGVNVILNQEMFIKFSKAQMLSKSGKCHSFDDQADGYVRGEGCGVLVLEKLSDAKKNRRQILAVIRGCCINHNGNSGGLTVPSGEAQIDLIKRCLDLSNVTINDLDYIEAHGTGTQLGDKIEVDALKKVFKERINKLPIGSIKENIGHLESAAGIAGIIKVLICMKKNILVRNINIKNLNKRIKWDNTPIEVVKKDIEWNKDKIIAGISSFGASGTNGHIIIQKYNTDFSNIHDDHSEFLLCVSGKTEKSLYDNLKNLKKYTEQKSKKELSNICNIYNRKRTHYKKRISIYGRNLNEFNDCFNKKINVVEITKPLYISLKGDLLFNHTLLIKFYFYNKAYREIFINLTNYEIKTYKADDEYVNIYLYISIIKYINLIGIINYKIYGDEFYNFIINISLIVDNERIGSIVKQYLIDKEHTLMADNEFYSKERYNSYVINTSESLTDIIFQLTMFSYEHASNIKWNYIYKDIDCNIEWLPNYQFQEKKYWLSSYGKGFYKIDEFIEKYIIKSNRFEKDRDFYYDFIIDLDNELGEHAINKEKVLVGTFQVLLIYKMIKELFDLKMLIREFTYCKEIKVFDNFIKLRVIFEKYEQNTFKGKIINKDDEIFSTFLIEPHASEEFNDSIDVCCGELINITQFYHNLYKCGLEIGDRYKCIDLIFKDENRIHAELRNNQFLIGYLDSGSQLLFIDKSELLMPFYFESFEYFDDLYKVDSVTAEILNFSDENINANLFYYCNKKIVACYKNYQLKKFKANFLPFGVKKELPNIDIYEKTVNVKELNLLDHKVFNQPVIPGAYFISQILSWADKQFKNSSYELKNISFNNPIIYNENDRIKQVILYDKIKNNIKFYSEKGKNNKYTLNSEMDVQIIYNDISTPYSLEMKKTYAKKINKIRILNIQNSIGLNLGKSFNWIEEMNINEDNINIKLKNGKESYWKYGIPIGLIDTAVQALGFIFNFYNKEGPYIPLGIKSIKKYRDFYYKSDLTCHIELKKVINDVIIGNALFYERGNCIYEINEMSLIKVNRYQLSNNNSFIYDEVWSDETLYLSDEIIFSYVIEIKYCAKSQKMMLTYYRASKDRVTIFKKLIFYKNDYIKLNVELNRIDPENCIIIITNTADDYQFDVLKENLDIFQDITYFFLKVIEIIEHSKFEKARICVFTKSDVNQKFNERPISSMIWGLFRSIMLESKGLQLLLVDAFNDWQEKFLIIMSSFIKHKKQIRIYGDRLFTQNIAKTRYFKSNYLAFDKGKRYIIIGGFGAIGYNICKLLLSKDVRDIVIIGRKKKNDIKLKELQACNENAIIQYIDMDVSDIQIKKKFIKLFDRKIGGIIYCAGNVIDKYHINYTNQQIEDIYNSKIKGMCNIIDVLEKHSFDYLLVFSSVVGVIGASGQSAYGAANHTMDSLCTILSNKNKNVLCIQWGPWNIGMFSSVDDVAKKRYYNRGIYTLDTELALNVLEGFLGNVGCHMIGNFQLISDMTETSSKDDNMMTANINKTVVKIIKKAIGLNEYDSLDLMKTFIELGMDSILLVELRMKINDLYKINLPIDIYFRNITIIEFITILENVIKTGKVDL